MTQNGVIEKWRNEAEEFSVARHPEGCTCEGTNLDCESPCPFCADVDRYMNAMYDHADVILSDYKECPF